MSFPTKSDREKCYKSRDEFWDCLDKHNSDVNLCTKFRKVFESSCSQQWVKHFDRKRNYLLFKDKLESEGYDKLDEENL